MERLTAADVMSRHVVSAHPEDDVRTIARLLHRRRIGAVPIVGPGGELVGLVSQADLVRFLLGAESGRAAADVMTPWVVSCEEDAPLEEVVRQMLAKRIHRVVITRGGRPAGIVTALDVVRAWSQGARREGRRRGKAEAKNLIGVLEEDHRRLRALSSEVDAWARSAGARQRPGPGRALIARLLAELGAHEDAEAGLLFPALRAQSPVTEAFLESMTMEHGLLAQLTRRVRSRSAAAAERLPEDALELTSRLWSHMDDEERHLFPAARHVPDPVLASLGAEALEARSRRPPSAAGRRASRRTRGVLGSPPTRRAHADRASQE